MSRKNNQPRKLFRSRLARREEKKSLRKAFIFILLTIGLFLLLVLYGIPLLIRVTAILTDIKSSSQPVEQTDNLPPPPPRFNLVPEFTKDSSLTLSGFAEAGATVEVFLNDISIGTILTLAEGEFVFDGIDLSEGKNEIYATATDEAGNKSQESQKLTTTVDKEKPELAVSSPKDGEQFYGEREKKLTVEGQTEPGISLKINDRLIILGQDGSFSTVISLNEGENIIKIVATDQAGNETEKELKVTFSS